MPELPEVQNFRRLLLSLISQEHTLRLERHSLEKAPPRKFIKDEEIDEIHSSELMVSDVLRKGKLICMVLTNRIKPKDRKGRKNAAPAPAPTTKYLFLHMGMTGRISTPDCIPKLQELSDANIYPPPYTYLRLIAGPNEACFSDPRKFGATYLKDVLSDDFDVLAPDAWLDTRPIKSETANLEKDMAKGIVENESSTLSTILSKLTDQSMGIKGILLDQKRAMCGVGNWVADEVLYQTRMHPDQNYLTNDQARILVHRLHLVLDEAVRCLSKDKDFPREWLFHYRWSKRGSKSSAVKDSTGRSIVFVTSGGRTSAVVPSLQKKKSQAPARTPEASKKKKETKATTTTTSRRKNEIKSEETPTKAEKKTKTKVKKESGGVSKPPQPRSRKRKGSSEDAPAGIRRGTRRSPRFKKL